MPNGLARPSAKTALCGGALSPPGRNTRIRPAPLSATKRSPLGAVRTTRGLESPAAKRSTAKPGSAFGTTAGVRGARRGGLPTEAVAKGEGRSAGVIRRRTPGASVRQSPKAAWPIRTPSAASAVPMLSQNARTPNPVRIRTSPCRRITLCRRPGSANLWFRRASSRRIHRSAPAARRSPGKSPSHFSFCRHLRS